MNDKLNNNTIELMRLQLKAMCGDEDAKKKIETANEMMVHLHDSDGTPFDKNFKELGMMLEEINIFFASGKAEEELGILDILTFVQAINNFSETLKPLYLKCLLLNNRSNKK